MYHNVLKPIIDLHKNIQIPMKYWLKTKNIWTLVNI